MASSLSRPVLIGSEEVLVDSEVILHAHVCDRKSQGTIWSDWRRDLRITRRLDGGEGVFLNGSISVLSGRQLLGWEGRVVFYNFSFTLSSPLDHGKVEINDTTAGIR